jgi:hypothetical protein
MERAREGKPRRRALKAIQIEAEPKENDGDPFS